MRPGKRKRERTGSFSPPLRSSSGAAAGSSSFSSTATLRSSLTPSSPATFIGLLQYYRHTNDRSDARQRQAFVMRHNLVHMQALQEVLRRTSLAEMRDREVVEWLLGTERWLREFHQPLLPPPTNSSSSSGDRGPSSLSSAPFPPASLVGDAFMLDYSSALSELRLLVIGVLHTMPWWRVVENVAKSHSDPAGSCGKATGGGGHSSGGGRRGTSARRGAADTAADRALAAQRAITRWHVRLQIAFERVCLVLIEKSQHTVRGVLEVLLKPCQLRPPVHDGARRSIPSDSFIRVLNAVATLYSSHYVVELLEGCIADFMPRRRWAERRHHVACTAVLLYVALEGHTPAFHPRRGNSQSLQRAIELLKSLRARGGECGSSSGGGVMECSLWRLPQATRSPSSLALGAGTSEDSGTDAGGNGGSSSSASPGWYANSHPHHRPCQPLLPSGGGAILPAGYVSATLFEDARSGAYGMVRQPALPRPGDPASRTNNTTYMTTTTNTSDTEVSDSTAILTTRPSTAGKGNGATGGGSDSSSTTAAATLRHTCARFGGGGGGSEETSLQRESTAGGAALAAGGRVTTASLLDVSAEHNNKLLAFRNNIIRLLLNRLLDIEQTLEPRDDKCCTNKLDSFIGTSGGGSGAGSSNPGSHVRSPFGSAPPSGQASPSGLFPVSTFTTATANMHGSSAGNRNTSFAFPSAPVAASVTTMAAAAAGGGGLVSDTTATAVSPTRSSPVALSPAGEPSPASFLAGPSPPHMMSSHQHLSTPFSTGAHPPLENYFNSLSLPYLRILRDCTTLVYGRLAEDLRRQQIAGSCGNADWWDEILHFYLTVVTRAERPVYLVYLAPSLAMLGTDDEPVNLLHKLITLVTKGSMPVEQPRSGVAGVAAASVGGGFGRGPSMAAAQPVRLRMAPPTGGSRRIVTMEERLRAAQHIFPLFSFLHSRLDATSGEGVRRRLLKWTAQELHRLGGAGLAISANTSNTVSSSFGGSVFLRTRQQPSRESRLALVSFAQCAAISELMEVDILPSAPSAPARKGGNSAASIKEGSGVSSSSSGRFTTVSVAGDASDSIATALQPLLARYTLHTEQPEELNDETVDTDDEAQQGHLDSREDGDGNGVRAGSASSVSSTSPNPLREGRGSQRAPEAEGETILPETLPRRQLDLRQMEYEGLLQPLLMVNCPWQACLR
jgi:hypothetical protein